MRKLQTKTILFDDGMNLSACVAKVYLSELLEIYDKQKNVLNKKCAFDIIKRAQNKLLIR